MNTLTVNRPTRYRSTDDPQVLTVLLRGATIARCPITLVWCVGANQWDSGPAEVNAAAVQPLTLDTRRGYVRVRT
jgi:hypothetical protein